MLEIDHELRACGFQHFSVTYDNSIQYGSVELRDSQVTDQQLRCAFHAQDRSGYILLWSDRRVLTRFYEITQELTKPHLEVEAQAYFASRPELGALPTRNAGPSEIDFARRIERFCGPDAQGLFVDYYGAAAINSAWFDSDRFEPASAAFKCVFYASTLTGLSLGFFGNDKATLDDEPAVIEN